MLQPCGDLDVLDRNPFRGLSRKGKGRSETNPPTEEEFNRLLQACDVLGDCGPYMRNLLTFAAYTGHEGGRVFGSKHEKMLSQLTMSGYRRHVCARAGLQFDFYLATNTAPSTTCTSSSDSFRR